MAQWQRIQLPVQETWVQSLHQEDPLEEGMAAHSSILAWGIPWTEEPGGLQSMGSQKIRQLSMHAQSVLVHKGSKPSFSIGTEVVPLLL